MGLFDYLHIKGHTAGSSNELSFDVLENARNDLDNTTRKRGKFGLAGLAKHATKHATKPTTTHATTHATKRTERGKQSARGKRMRSGEGALAPTGNVPFTRGTVTVTSSDEMLQRPKHRRGTSSLGGLFAGGLTGSRSITAAHAHARKRAPLRVLGALVATLVTIGVMCAAIVINHQLYLERLDFTNRLVVLASEISQVDESLIQADLLARDPLADASQQTLSSILGSLPGIESELVGIQEKTTRIRIDKPAGYNAGALEEVESATSARIALLDEAAKLLEAAAEAHEFIARAEQAWQLVIDSTALARQSIASANEAANQSALQDSRALTKQALDSLRQASSQLKQLQSDVQGLNFGAHLRYLDTKTEALQYALDVDDALFARDREAATEVNMAYNSTEEEAASQASLITTSPADEVRDAMQERIAAHQVDYERTREQVVSADSALRTRLP